MFHFALRPGRLPVPRHVRVGRRGGALSSRRSTRRTGIYRANPVGRPLRALPRSRRWVRAAAGAKAGRAAAIGRADADAGRAAPAQLLEQVRAAERAGDRRARDRPHRPAPRASCAIAEGEPSHNLLQAIRPELRLELRTALFQALQLQRARRRRAGAASTERGPGRVREDVGAAGAARRLAGRRCCWWCSTRSTAAGVVGGRRARRRTIR